MKILLKIPYLFTCVLAVFLAIASCNKADVITSATEGTIYMPAAARNSSIALLFTDTAQTIPFSAAYGGLNYPGQDITVNFKIDSMLIPSYNAAHGTNYVILPALSYQIPSLSAVIKAGQTSSDIIPVGVTTTKLSQSMKYLLPITITNVTSGNIDSSLSTTYFAIDTIQRLEKDITAMATITVSKENGGGSSAGEGSPKLIDGDYNSKFLTDGFPQDFWVQLKFPSAQILGAYTLTSGNDAPERDAKDWDLDGSNDGSTWTPLDSKSGEYFSDRNLTKRYEFNNHTAYTYYRLNITANGGSDLLQISEWRVITYP